jgi:hypothetical protein
MSQAANDPRSTPSERLSPINAWSARAPRDTHRADPGLGSPAAARRPRQGHTPADRQAAAPSNVQREPTPTADSSSARTGPRPSPRYADRATAIFGKRTASRPAIPAGSASTAQSTTNLRSADTKSARSVGAAASLRSRRRDSNGSIINPTKGGFMESMLLNVAGHRRSPATMPGYHRGRPPRNKGSCRCRHEPFYADRAGMPTWG